MFSELPRDITRIVKSHLSEKDIGVLSRVNKATKAEIENDDIYWIKKTVEDFNLPDFLPQFLLTDRDIRDDIRIKNADRMEHIREHPRMYPTQESIERQMRSYKDYYYGLKRLIKTSTPNKLLEYGIFEKQIGIVKAALQRGGQLIKEYAPWETKKKNEEATSENKKYASDILARAIGLDPRIAKLLIREGITGIDHYNIFPAVSSGDLELVKLVYETPSEFLKGKTLMDYRKTNQAGDPQMLISKSGSPEVLEYLISLGAVLTDAGKWAMLWQALGKTDWQQKPLLDFAVYIMNNFNITPDEALIEFVQNHDDYLVIKNLLKLGASKDALNRAFIESIRYNNKQLIRTLLGAGADVHYLDDEALIRIVSTNYPEIIAELKKNVWTKETAEAELMKSVTREIKEIINLLLDKGADPNARNGEVLRRAKGNQEITDLLISRGAVQQIDPVANPSQQTLFLTEGQAKLLNKRGFLRSMIMSDHF